MASISREAMDVLRFLVPVSMRFEDRYMSWQPSARNEILSPLVKGKSSLVKLDRFVMTVTNERRAHYRSTDGLMGVCLSRT